VFVDGQLSAIAMPFPVIYTGGINPLLWRPLTGMMSFDIPSHRSIPSLKKTLISSSSAYFLLAYET